MHTHPSAHILAALGTPGRLTAQLPGGEAAAGTAQPGREVYTPTGVPQAGAARRPGPRLGLLLLAQRGCRVYTPSGSRGRAQCGYTPSGMLKACGGVRRPGGAAPAAPAPGGRGARRRPARARHPGAASAARARAGPPRSAPAQPAAAACSLLCVMLETRVRVSVLRRQRGCPPARHGQLLLTGGSHASRDMCCPDTDSASA